MKASLPNLINGASVLSSLSAPLSPSSWGLCVCVGGGDGRPHTFTEASEGTIVCSDTPLTLYVKLILTLQEKKKKIRQSVS